MTIFALILSFVLSFHPSIGATSYAIEKQAALDATVWTETACGVEACSLRTYSPATAVVEQVRVRAINAAGSSLSAQAWTLLALDWSRGNANYSTYTGNGAMQGTRVKVMLPSPRWTVVYSYQGAIPIYVKATCDFDVTGAGGQPDGVVNLSDFVVFGAWWATHGRPLSELANFGSDHGATKQEWR